MYLPNRELAFVPEEKIVRYLLDLNHEDGGPKAVFFMRFGFSLERWHVLAEALINHAHQHEVTEIDTSSAFGVKYIVVGRMTTPDGRRPNLRVVWIILHGTSAPRLTSAFPE